MIEDCSAAVEVKHEDYKDSSREVIHGEKTVSTSEKYHNSQHSYDSVPQEVIDDEKWSS